MMMIRNIAVLIPALNPDHKLVDLVKALKQIGLVNVLVVDDGSDPSAQVVFEQLQTCRADVICHKENRGKGAALKTGIDAIKKNQPEVIGVVTADADGQHIPKDILKVAQALTESNMIVLGTRDLSRSEVPLASKIGNLFSIIYYRLKTGKLLKDTQTGLRGIPAKYYDFALNVEGDRYEYEMRFLEQMNENKIDYQTVDIETIYEKDRVSHFRNISDSYKIYKSFFKNIASSLLSAVIDISAFMLLVQLGNSIFTATAISRILSGIFNFLLNKLWVFEKRDSHNTSIESIKYLALFILQLVFSGILTDAVSSLLTFSSSLLISKILVDCFLFVTSFIVQRFWIFPNHKNTRNNSMKNNKRKNKHTFAYFYTILLIAATVWSLLDTFVIADKVAAVDDTLANTSIYADLETVYAASDDPENDEVEDVSNDDTDAESSEDSSTSTPESLDPDQSVSVSTEPIITETSYQDENIQITINTIREFNTDIYIADIVISDIAYLKTALANDTFGRNIKETTSDMAEDHDAILAINGDYYGFRSAGIVIRNGVLYQSTARSLGNEALVIGADGNFTIVDEGIANAQTLYDEGALQVFTFGPGLIEDGEINVSDSTEVGQSMRSNPRTAIGMIEPLHYVFVVSDGRTSQSEGLSLLELAEVLQAYGCTVAYNLDGGGSSTMVFNGEVVNNPTDGRSFGERKVSDIIYIGGLL